MSAKKPHRTKKKRPAPQLPKPAITYSSKPDLTPRQLAQLLADAAIACERNGERKKFEEFLEAFPILVAPLATTAGEPDHWLAREFSSPAIGLSDAVSMLAALAEGLAQKGKAEKR